MILKFLSHAASYIWLLRPYCAIGVGQLKTRAHPQNIGRVASAEVTLQLIKVKCLPVLLYGLGACPLTKSDLQSPDFVINRFFIKLFTTKNIEIVKSILVSLYQVYYGSNVSKFELSFKCFQSAL